jgi:hypothetical protein
VKQKIEIEIDVPDGYEVDGVDFYGPQFFCEGILNHSCLVKFKPIKPATKVIDLSCVVGSGIDCEFSYRSTLDSDFSSKIVGSLERITGERLYKKSGTISSWYKCRVRQSPHVHFWKGEYKCPLPHGLKIKVWYLTDNGGASSIITYDYFAEGFSWSEVIGFEVLGVADGWRYEWEEE